MPRSQTWAELRTVRREVKVTVPGEKERAPYPRERLVDGQSVNVSATGLAWLRRDGGATLLVRGPAKLVLRSDGIEVSEGRLFVDTPPGVIAELVTPGGPLHLANVRASIDVSEANAITQAYVLSGEVRTDGADRATAGEQLLIKGKAGATKVERTPAVVWEDWTGGLATTDRMAEPAPYGVGTVGARRPGDQGSPRFALAIQRLDVRVKIDGDLAITEVDEVFFNPSSEQVEGIYRFRTPEGASLHRFGVDREGVIVWGRVKEKQAAAAQYQANVYQGSQEDPALLEWDAPGVYRARLYPIGPGDTRRVVVRYAEWLGRTGEKGERRLYVYPMAAEGSAGSLPLIEELTVRVNLAKAEAKEVRVGMTGVREDNDIIVREHDFVPRADLALELFDDGLTSLRGVSAKHTVDVESLPPNERGEALRRAKNESDYVLVPIRASDMPPVQGGLDLVIVVDTSAATDTASLAIARAATTALLTHLGPDDRAAVWAGDSTVRPIVPGGDKLGVIDEGKRREILTNLATVERGGATDLGGMLIKAATALDPERRGAVVYIGDGQPTVGELNLADLRAGLAKLPRPVRIFGLGIGDGADMGILKGLARGSFAERIGDANAASRAALRLLEYAERPVWLGAAVDLGPTVERIFPRDLGAIVADESLVAVGRLTGRTMPTSVTITTPNGKTKAVSLRVTPIDDLGDLRRRWADGRLAQMMDEAVGRAAMVDLGSRYGIITPVTSLYVPTKKEMTPQELTELEQRKRQLQRELSDGDDKSKSSRSKLKASPSKYDMNRDDAEFDMEEKETEQIAENNADNKEGGTGTRAKGEEGSMGNPYSKTTGNRYGVKGPADSPDPHIARQAALRDSAEFGMIGLLNSGSGSEPNAPVAPWGRDDSVGRGAAPPAQAPAPVTATAPAMEAERSPVAAATAVAAAKPMARPPTCAPGDPLCGDFGGDVGVAPSASAPASPAEINGRLEAAKNAPSADETAQAYRRQLDANPNAELTPMPPPPPPEMQGWAQSMNGLDVAEPYGGTIDTLIPGYKSPESGAVVLSGSGGKRRSSGGDFWGTVDLPKSEALAKSGESRFSLVVQVGDVPHVALQCGAAAFAPFEERIGLWRERLSRVAGNAYAVANVYRQALFACEAPTFRERSKLLSMMLDFMPNVAARVSLWRVMFNELGAADTLYRGILARVKTTDEMRALHQALGLKTMDPGLLEKALLEAKTPEARVKKLRSLVAVWPDDFALSLKLLDALEDATDDAGARELGRDLRARADADAQLRSAVGELYLRLASRATDPAQKALDEAEARRAFGEIVEFSPDDPVARRRLGDLLRAHGWHDEAARQYETLAKLSPDDPGVSLLIAAAAEGVGKLEEAIKWTEKAGASGAPDMDQSPAHTARAFAATYLAWGRLDAREKGNKQELEALIARLLRVRSGEGNTSDTPPSTRVTLTWVHPEFHPVLWSNALGAAMPAPEGDITLGISQVMLPVRDSTFVEVHIDPKDLEHVARLGANAILTVVFDEAKDTEKIVKIPLTFTRDGSASRRFTIQSGDVQEVTP